MNKPTEYSSIDDFLASVPESTVEQSTPKKSVTSGDITPEYASIDDLLASTPDTLEFKKEPVKRIRKASPVKKGTAPDKEIAEHLKSQQHLRADKIRRIESEKFDASKSANNIKYKHKEADYTIDPKLSRKFEDESDEDKATLETNDARLNSDVSTILNFYLSKIPSLVTLKDQLAEVNTEMARYKKIGDKENADKAKVIADKLKSIIRETTNVVKNKYDSDLSAQKKAKMLDDPEYIRAQNAYRDAQMIDRELSPSLMAKHLDELRSTIRVSESVNNKADGIMGTDDDIMQLDDIIPEGGNTAKLNQLYKDYDDYCYMIGQNIGLSIEEVQKLSSSTLQTKWREHFRDEIAKAKLDVDATRIELSKIRQKLNSALNEGTDIVSLISEIYDLEDIDEKEQAQIKNILSASYMNLASAIAYNVCRRLNKLNELDEAKCGAYEKLAEEINNWVSKQSESADLISFGDALGARLRKGAERALLNLSSTQASASTQANIHHYDKKAVDLFLKYNPEFADLSREIILDIIDTEEARVIHEGKTKGVKGYRLNKVGRESSATDLSAMIGGEEDDVDFWSMHDSSSSDLSVEDMETAKSNMVTLASSIKKLLNYFKIDEKRDADGNLVYQENQNSTMFDDTDKIIFLCMFDFDFNKTGGKDVKNQGRYTESDMAEIIAATMDRKQGLPIGTTEPMAPSSVNRRKKAIPAKLKQILAHDNEIERALKYLYNWSRTNKQAMLYASNAREGADIKSSFDYLVDVKNRTGRDMSSVEFINGATLDDVFEVDSTHPTDSEIANLLKF